MQGFVDMSGRLVDKRRRRNEPPQAFKDQSTDGDGEHISQRSRQLGAGDAGYELCQLVLAFQPRFSDDARKSCGGRRGLLGGEYQA